VLLLVRVRLDVQVFAAHGTKPGAVGTAEDLRRQRQRERIARPRGEVEHVVADVRRAELLVGVVARRVVLARTDATLDDRVGEATLAGAVKPTDEVELENGACRGTCRTKLRLNVLGNREVALTAEFERRERDLLFVLVLLA
jgi:hypothetical protein